MQFQPGNKYGNGRPKIPEETKKLLSQGADKAVTFWLATLANEEINYNYRLTAAEKLAAYGFGKPRESVDIEMVTEVPESYEETVRKIDELLATRNGTIVQPAEVGQGESIPTA